MRGALPKDLTQLLAECDASDRPVLDRLLPLVYGELRQLAANYLRRERPEHTLQTTALVHEAYLRLAGNKDVNWQSHTHFRRVAARVMRCILVDHAKHHGARKRAGGDQRLTLDEALVLSPEPAPYLVELNECLHSLADFDARKSRVVELRVFGGLSIDETAEVLEISPATVMRDWTMAKAWLYREMRRDET